LVATGNDRGHIGHSPDLGQQRAHHLRGQAFEVVRSQFEHLGARGDGTVGLLNNLGRITS
jgi:hypothetical protein